MDNSNYVLMTVECPQATPSLEDAARSLNLSSGDIDPTFGVIEIDPERHLFAVQVRASAIKPETGDGPFRGPFSNPRIEPMRPLDKIKGR